VAIDGRTPSVEQIEAQIASLRMIALVIMTSSDMTSSDIMTSDRHHDIIHRVIDS